MTTTCTRVLRRVAIFFNPSPRAPRGARLHPSHAFEAPHAVTMQIPQGRRDCSGCMTMPLHTVTAWCESTHSFHLFGSVAAGVSHLYISKAFEALLPSPRTTNCQVMVTRYQCWILTVVDNIILIHALNQACCFGRDFKVLMASTTST